MADVEHNYEEMSREDLVAASRAQESKINVLRNRADLTGTENPALTEASAELDKITSRIKEMDDNPVAADPEGTAPSLADKTGTYAPDADTAQLGGVGIDDSNANPERSRQIAQARAEGDTERANQLLEEGSQADQASQASMASQAASGSSRSRSRSRAAAEAAAAE